MPSVIQKLFHGGTIETSISESRIYNTLYVCMRARTRRIYIVSIYVPIASRADRERI